MKSIKYELLGFSGLLGVTLFLLAIPDSDAERRAVTTTASELVPKLILDAR